MKGTLVETDAFPAVCAGAGLARPVKEYRFAPPRRWRFDYAWPVHRVALEVEGGIYTRGRHARGEGMRKDMEKYNAAALAGWTVLRVMPKQLMAAETFDMLRRAIDEPAKAGGED